MEIDPRIRNLSYSSLLTLHSCPRKFQLYKLGASSQAYDPEIETPQSVTFAYGHMIGRGIQWILEGKTIEQVLWNEFLEWGPDLLDENIKQNKSFFGAVHALQQFSHLYSHGYLNGYELVEYSEKPASELSFCIEFPDGFMYRGFVDAVLQHSITGEVLVLECKTTASASVNPAQYKNSAQAIGYSIVLDAIFPKLSSYKVLYLVYQSKSAEFVQLPFDKSYYQRALWIQELLLDIERIKSYESASIYPMHGESCYSFFRECEYLQTCTLSTERLITHLTPEIETKIEKELEEYQIKISLSDLIAAQLSKENLSPIIEQPILTESSDGDMIL